MPRLTDKQRKKIIADYAAGMSQRKIAEKYKTSPTTVARIIKQDPETVRIVAQKKEENTRAVLDCLERQGKRVQSIIDKVLRVLDDEEKLAGTGVQQLATALGIIIDKFTGTPVEVERLRAEVEKLKAQAANLRGEDPQSGGREDDPITKSLKEQFKG